MTRRRGSSRIERGTRIGEYLTAERLRQRLTQEEIAKRIGRSRSYICRIETGQRERKSVPRKVPRGFILYQLAEAYGADLAEVLEKAHWPQLPLLDTTEEEHQQLIRYLNEIRQRKSKDRQY